MKNVLNTKSHSFLKYIRSKLLRICENNIRFRFTLKLLNFYFFYFLEKSKAYEYKKEYLILNFCIFFERLIE